MIDEILESYRKEENRIKHDRLLAWSSVGLSDSILGIECRPLTGRAWVDLWLSENSIIREGELSKGAGVAYIWRVSAAYSAGDDWRTLREKNMLADEMSRYDADQVVTSAINHANSAFQEVPKGLNGREAIDNSFAAVEGIVSALDEVGARYGVSPDDLSV